MKHAKRNGIILALITIIVLYFVLKDNFMSVVQELQKANLWLILVVLIVTIIYIIFQSLALHQIIKTYEPNYKYKKTVQLTLITNFFNGVTPFATGGQPMQVYLLKKDGIRVTNGTNIIIQNFILYQLALVIYGFIAMFLNYGLHIFKDLPVLGSLITIGFTINTLIMIGLFIISFGKKINQWLITIGIKVLTKLKIVKDQETTLISWKERLDVFHEGAVNLRKSKKICVKSFIYQFLSLTCFYILPLFVFYALNVYEDIGPLQVIVASAYIMIIGSFVPIPGASGGIEYGFLKFFGVFISGGILSAALLVWRFMSYYLLMMIGGIVLSFRKDVLE